jgi:hypothetical protein
MKPTTKRLVIALAVLVGVVATLFTVWNIRSARRLEAAIAAAQAAGLPERVEAMPAWLDARYGEIAPGDNGAAKIQAAFALVENAGIEAPEWPEDRTGELPELEPGAREKVDRYAAAIDLLREGLAAPRCRLHANWEDGIAMEVPFLLPVMELAQLLDTRIVLDLAEGEGLSEAGRDDLELRGRLPGVLAEEPTLIARLIRLVLTEHADQLIRRLAEHDTGLTAVELLACHERTELPEGNALHTVGGETAFALSAYQTVMDGALSELGMGDPGFVQRLLLNSNLITPLLRSDMAHLLEHYVRLWELRDRDPAEVVSTVEEIQQSLNPEDPGITNLFSTALSGDISGSMAREAGIRAYFQATREGLQQLAAWEAAPPDAPTERTFGEGEAAWTVQWK